MSISLSAVWSQVEKLILDGISVIPVRDKDDEESGRVAKTPFGSWKRYQEKPIGKSELWALMEHHKTEAVGIVCGKVSGNLEAIDIDVKYRGGIDAILFQDIKTIYPELFVKLRIHKTPSGGWHILYRVSDGTIPGNLKLAGREATEQELEERPKNKTYNFIETRGEGGYVLCPPSLGYEVSKDRPIPILTWEERCSLISLCETYNEVIKIAPAYKPTKSESEYYTENPWDHFNGSCNPVEFLKEFGWEEFKSNGHFIWFTRPGKTKGVSASWNVEKRIFYIFTSSTELEASKGYHPVTVLAELKFAGDKRATYQYLVSCGFGKVKPSIEKAVVKKRATAGQPIPSNFSHHAKAQFESIRETLEQDHPYGLFWEQDEEDKFTISREGIYQVSAGLGFKTFNGDIVQIIGNIIYKRTERYYYDSLKDYIREEDANLYEDICNAYESFIQRAGSFTITRLNEIDKNLILSDTKDNAYKLYKNGYLSIDANDINFCSYDMMDRFIWDHNIQKRDYRYGADGKYIEYVKLAVTDFNQAKKILGYLAHEFKDETTGYIIVLTEQCPDPKQGGGSGKNVFCNLLKLTTTYTSKPGSQAKFDEKFFQSWNGQKIFGISDVPKNFDFAFLKEPSTGSFIWKKLFKDEVEVDVKDAPKFIVQTNFSYDNTDGGLARRIIPLEFTDFFTKAGGLDVYFNAHFPNEWDENDYAGYDNLIATSIQEWIAGGRKLVATELTNTGWQKQWEQTFGHATSFVLNSWEDWTVKGFITNEEFKKTMEAYYNDNHVHKTYWPSSAKLNLAIKAYADHNKISYITDKKIRFVNGEFKCRLFGEVDIDAIRAGGSDSPF
ncbi:Bifunctional DNA primase/polymerase, N-terminal [Mucilaginibacter lappiensis]|uniref:DNA primase/polymerase bifunctional N-terminal domain-containing protein n=1 Tax=Mucilaginibacter lappiensis TaxID=354630 RepID=A0ABR6PJ09_9SPHI|nr:bifunctional DNA primase/polymerase [Mucilaginibacter lappiensis]MBB6109748.1 hypothetical protein [Mucilaginibacter lappiensis]SIR14113.1 Bifunctional DNA primase/polymerase, N-terminal [Mucilaginibacter lappiensis]